MASSQETWPLHAELLGDGPPLLFIHGAGGTPRANFPFLDEMADRHTVIAPDLPGSGMTSRGLGPLTTNGIADQIRTLLDLLDISSCGVLGYSMGSSVAIELAAAHPAKVSRLVLTAGFAFARPSLINNLQVWTRLQDCDASSLGRFILGAVVSPKTLDSNGEEWIAQRALETAEGLSRGTRAHLELIRQLDVRVALAATRQPLLIIEPSRDRLVDPAHSRDMLAIRPDAAWMSLDSGHATGDEAAVAWSDAVQAFFQRP